MNEKLKFNIERLKRDFEDVISEMVEEIGDLESEIKNSFSEVYVNELEEEINELKDEIKNHSTKELIEKEFGDVLFALINYSRFLDINPEDALERTNKKFIRRFKYLEQKADEIGKTLHEMTLAEMDVYWEEAKSQEA